MIVVGPVGPKAARHAVMSWHYSRSMPVGAQQSYGVWEDERFIGAILIGRGASPHLGTALGLGRLEVCELTRVALREHAAPVSQIVPLAISQLRTSSPKLRAVVSFADPWHGHHGGIYQAMGWLYLGTSATANGYRDAAGKLHHQRVVATSGIVRQFGRATRSIPRSSVEPVELPGKHRYVLPLDRGMRRRLVPRCEPYPRAVEVSTATR